MTRRRRTARRGISFLEVVFASALLATAAATIASSFDLVDNIAVRNRHRLNAYELAHRLVLQFMDDPESLPPTDLPLPMGNSTYRYILNDQVLAADQGSTGITIREGVHSAQAGGFVGRAQARIVMVTVEVYVEEDGRRAGSPIATLTRIYDPFMFADEDPEAFMGNLIHMAEDEPALRPILEQVREQQRQKAQEQQAQDKGGRR